MHVRQIAMYQQEPYICVTRWAILSKNIKHNTKINPTPENEGYLRKSVETLYVPDNALK